MLRPAEPEPFRLAGFCFDEGIDAPEVLLVDAEATGGELERRTRDDALAIARSRGAHLVVSSWTRTGSTDGGTPLGVTPVCHIGPVAVPVRWERTDEPDEQAVIAGLDGRLWFEAGCGGRDLLVGNAHTFRGRMTAWCPETRSFYGVSPGAMGEMSDETRYFVLGHLSGSEPAPPVDDTVGGGDVDPADLAAWRASNRRFRREGTWSEAWRTCRECGCVLLPGTFAERCEDRGDCGGGG